MFVVTLRKGGLKKLAVVCACGAVLAASAFAVNALVHKDTPVSAAAGTGATENLKMEITGAEDLAAFLRGFALEPDVTTAAVNKVTVPRKWDDSFVAFNDVIKESGLDLSKIKGKKVDKWLVLAPALSDEAQKTYAVVLVYKNEAVGAYLLQKPSGEVLPLKSTAAAAANAALTPEEIAANAAPTEGEGTPVNADANVPLPEDATVNAPAPDAAPQDVPVEAPAEEVPVQVSVEDFEAGLPIE